jgi:hypothetical protein
MWFSLVPAVWIPELQTVDVRLIATGREILNPNGLHGAWVAPLAHDVRRIEARLQAHHNPPDVVFGHDSPLDFSEQSERLFGKLPLSVGALNSASVEAAPA